LSNACVGKFAEDPVVQIEIGLLAESAVWFGFLVIPPKVRGLRACTE
jgi:hypothetical protein